MCCNIIVVAEEENRYALISLRLDTKFEHYVHYLR